MQPKPQRCCGRAPRPSRQVRRCTRRRSKRPAPRPLPRTNAEDEELCAWLQQKASLTQRVVDKVLPKLHDENVYDVSGLLALHSIDGLGDVFSRVVAVQVADALDAFGNLSIGVSKSRCLEA